MTKKNAEKKPPGLTYRDAGVDLDAQDKTLARIRIMVRRAFDSRVLTDIGRIVPSEQRLVTYE